MKKIYLYVSLICSLLALVGCRKDWLEVKADKTQAIPSTLGDFQALLDYTLMMNNYDPALGEIASDGHYIREQTWQGTVADLQRNAYTWSNNYPYTNLLYDWNYSYGRILRCNIVLEALEKNVPTDILSSETWKNIKGQALFQRAIVFFGLSSNFAPPYSESTAGQLGIPLRLSSDISEKSVRSTVKEVYDVIIDNLKQAKDLLPVTPLYYTRASKPAAFAMLARCYLSMGKYEEALAYADSCLTLHNNSLMDYNTLNVSASFIGILNAEVIFHNSIYGGSSHNTITTNCRIDEDLVNLYDENDLRKQVFFRTNSDGTISFKGNYTNSATSLFSGLATDEIYLIRAECRARAGQVNEAMDDLNTLLRTRWKKDEEGQTTYTDQTAVNAEEALDLILTERRKELLLRGLRWTDLRRLNQEERYKQTLTRTIGGETYTLEPNSYKYTFPLPDDVIQMSGMPQNPGWD